MYQTAYFYPRFSPNLRIAGKLIFLCKLPFTLQNFLASGGFYQGRAFALFGARRPRVNLLGDSPRQSVSFQYNLDGFFFPYKTHGGYSFRPLGLFIGSYFISSVPKVKKLSFSAEKPSLRSSQNLISGRGSSSLGVRNLPPRVLAAALKRRRRRAWVTRWASAPSKGALTPAGSLGVPPLKGLKGPRIPVKTSHTSSWFLEAARFKPGLSTEWRKSRLAFNYSWGLNFLRQRRLTRFFLRLKGLGGFSFLRLITFSAGHVLAASFTAVGGGLLTRFTLASWACRLNGRPITNPFIQLFSGDVLQLLSLKPATTAWASKLSQKRFTAFLRDQFISNKPSSFLADIPTFLEADELTLTSVVLGSPDFKALLPHVQAGPAPYLTFRLYNWKYTT